MALILAGGVTGALIEDLLTEAAVPHQTIRVKGRTRISFTVYDQAAGVEYRFVPEGPTAEPQDCRSVLSALETTRADWLVASGSLERGMPVDIYRQIAAIALRRGIPFVLDTSGPPLAAALGPGIDLIKPSLGELEALTGRPLPTDQEQEAEAMALVQAGKARMVAVTLGENGAFVASAEGIVRLPGLSAPFRSAVGAGDSFLAAMVQALARNEPISAALGWGIAAGTATVICAGTARLTMAEVQAQHARLPD